MKIGEFSERFGIPVDTVRYYMEIGLLSPQKIGKNYEFQESDAEDMRFICELKRCKFSIASLSEIMSMRQLLNSRDCRMQELMLREFVSQHKLIEDEVSELESILALINTRIEEYTPKSIYETTIGLPLEFISIMRCPCCGSEFRLENTRIEKGSIISASAVCVCGYSMIIRDGLVIVIEEENATTNEYEISPWWDNCIGGFIGNLDMRGTRIVSTMNRCYDKLYLWLKESPYFTSKKRKTILTCENNSGRFLLYYLLDKPEGREFLKTATIIMYVTSEKVPNYIRQLVSSFEVQPKLVFIVGNSYRLPLAEKCVDLLFDDHSSFYFFAARKKYIVDTLRDNGYLSDSSEVYGAFHSDFLKMLKENKPIYNSPLLSDIIACKNRNNLITDKIYMYNKFDKNVSKSEAFIVYKYLNA